MRPSEVRPASANEEPATPRDALDTDGYHLTAPDAGADDAIAYDLGFGQPTRFAGV